MTDDNASAREERPRRRRLMRLALVTLSCCATAAAGLFGALAFQFNRPPRGHALSRRPTGELAERFLSGTTHVWARVLLRRDPQRRAHFGHVDREPPQAPRDLPAHARIVVAQRRGEALDLAPRVHAERAERASSTLAHVPVRVAQT